MATQNAYAGAVADANPLSQPVAWTNPSFAQGAPDNVDAQALTFGSQRTHMLDAENYGFTVTGSVTNITVNVRSEDSDHTGNSFWNTVRQVNAGATIGSTLAATQFNGSGYLVLTVTGTFAAWGSAPSIAQATSSTYGVQIDFSNLTGGSNTLGVDSIEIVLTYTPAGGGAVKRLRALLGVGLVLPMALIGGRRGAWRRAMLATGYSRQQARSGKVINSVC